MHPKFAMYYTFAAIPATQHQNKASPQVEIKGGRLWEEEGDGFDL
jgi:hypothetical protein